MRQALSVRTCDIVVVLHTTACKLRVTYSPRKIGKSNCNTPQQQNRNIIAHNAAIAFIRKQSRSTRMKFFA
jgi:hypothetical protein